MGSSCVLYRDTATKSTNNVSELNNDDKNRNKRNGEFQFIRERERATDRQQESPYKHTKIFVWEINTQEL